MFYVRQNAFYVQCPMFYVRLVFGCQRLVLGESQPQVPTTVILPFCMPCCPVSCYSLLKESAPDFQLSRGAATLGGTVINMCSDNLVREIVAEYRERLREVLGNELDSLVLYGSQARGDATAESDIDVLCIMKQPFDYGELVLRTARVSAAVSLEHDVVVSTAFVTREDFETRNTPFLMNVRREAATV